jgi:uncharacterized protein
MQHPDYSDTQQLLLTQRSLADAAEAHGTLTGGLCASADYHFEDWLREILPAGSADPAATAPLRELYDATAGSLVETDMQFAPLLPADAQPIAARTAALAEWCQGFLYGLGAGSIPDAGRLPGEIGEFVRDLGEITRADVDADQSEDSNESAYAELVEFVRVGVQLLYEELAPARRAPPAQAAALH